MPGGGGKPQVVSNDPPKYLQPYLRDIASQASNVYNNFTPAYFPGQTYANFSPEQNQAMDLTSQRALSGSPVNQAAQNNITSTLNGDYLYGGPGFNAAYQAASNKIIPQVQSLFGTAGRSGSGLAQTAMTGALGDAFASQYGQERNNQMQAAGMAPTLANQDYLDLSQLSDVGAQRQAMSQQGIDEAMARHDFAQNLPYYKLQQYAGIISPQAAMGGTQTSPMYQNRAAGALGGALAGAQLGSLVPGIGTGIGAIGGGLLGVLR